MMNYFTCQEFFLEFETEPLMTGFYEPKNKYGNQCLLIGHGHKLKEEGDIGLYGPNSPKILQPLKK